MTAEINKLKEHLEVSHTGAMMLGNQEDAFRISRALTALLADTNIDIFSKEFEIMMFENECKSFWLM